MIACDACEEWYHGDCINISEKEAKLIKQYFCIRCTEEDNSLITRWKTRHSTSAHHDPTSVATSSSTPSSHRSRKQQRKEQRHNLSHDDDYMPPAANLPAHSTSLTTSGNVSSVQHHGPHGSSGGRGGGGGKRCNDCMGCLRTEDCGRCDVCQQQSGGGGGSGRHRERCKQRICINYGGISNRKRRNSSSDRDGAAAPHNAHLQTLHARQCYGPACTAQARYGSKYCSDACGSRLATSRIFQVLPQRIQEWALSPCLAEDKNIKALDSVRKQQLEVRSVLQELDQRHRELDAVLERARRATVDPLADADGDDESTAAAEVSIYCITCGLEIHSRTAIKHMEKCFNKYESQASFGSIFKTRIEGNNMFCDYFNPSNRTYCKRLRVLCPEHCKDPKIGDYEVCGCPLVTNVFSLTGEFCRAPKKSCGKHHVWEKLRRAEIDLERVRQWLKMDELLERERQIRLAMASRAGVLALMLHSTYNHEVMEEITRASHQDQHAMQRELAKRFTATKTVRQ